MAVKHKAQRAAAGAVLDQLLKYVDKDPQGNLLKLVDKAQGIVGNLFPAKSLEGIRRGAEDPENVWNQFAISILQDIDRDVIKKMFLALGLHAAYHGTKTVRENREKYQCNIPWIILLDPTSACNLKCKGCWAAEYGYRQNLSYEELSDIIRQGKEMGTHFYMFTGGEPLVRKDDVIRLCEENPDCAFLAYTNATLVDQKFCDDMKRVGNFALAISVEGTRESNDGRRGDGVYDKVMAAMDLLKQNKLLFGISVCYTSANVDAVTSDAFIDLMIEKGVKFGAYFNYMPVGHDAYPELIPTPEQRSTCMTGCAKCATAKPESPCSSSIFRMTPNMSAAASRAGATISTSTPRVILSPACSFTFRIPTSARTRSSRHCAAPCSRPIGAASRLTITTCAPAPCWKTRIACAG